jgi:hypothetical protein
MAIARFRRSMIWRTILVPVLVALGVVLVLVSLIEGPAIQDFLYAIF